MKRMQHTGGPYTKPIVVKLNAEGVAVLDRLRGKTARGTFLRNLLKAEARRRAS